MKFLRLLVLGLCFSVAVSCAHATTVIPPTFDQLVNEAEIIFQGTVTEVNSHWVGEGADRHIMTYVTFKVDDSLKGAPGNTYTIRMLGGTVGNETMEVSDTPTFKVGNRDILFVEHNGSQFVPLVGIMHGRFHVQNDSAGRDVVATDDGTMLANVAKLGRDVRAASEGQPMSADSFKAAILTKLANK
ncbi:MAG: hypothetical protein ABJB09_04995 [Verrucomicrobiota bacterium]